MAILTCLTPTIESGVPLYSPTVFNTLFIYPIYTNQNSRMGLFLSGFT